MNLDDALEQAKCLKHDEETKDFKLESEIRAWVYRKGETYYVISLDKKTLVEGDRERVQFHAMKSFDKLEDLEKYLETQKLKQ